VRLAILELRLQRAALRHGRVALRLQRVTLRGLRGHLAIDFADPRGRGVALRHRLLPLQRELRRIDGPGPVAGRERLPFFNRERRSCPPTSDDTTTSVASTFPYASGCSERRACANRETSEPTPRALPPHPPYPPFITAPPIQEWSRDARSLERALPRARRARSAPAAAGDLRRMKRRSPEA